jgi:hypothetical protein
MTDSQGRTLVARNDYLPQREIMTSIGPVDIKAPKTRYRGGQAIHFRSESSGQRDRDGIALALPQRNLNR